MFKIKKADEVIVISGKDKAKIGTVKSVYPGDGKVLVEGINMVKKHVKPDPNKGVEGGLVEKEARMDISNVAIYNPATKKADRVGIKINKLDDGSEVKVRYFKSNGEQIDV